MDRFLDTTLSGGSGDQYDPTHTRPLGYYDQTDLPFYYELATQFATSDTWYSPIPANTVPNRMYLFAATTYGHAYPRRAIRAIRRGSGRRSSAPLPTQESPGATTTRTTACSWRTGPTGTIRRFRAMCGTFRSTTTSCPVRMRTQNLPQVVFIERAGATGCDEHPGQQHADRSSRRADHHHCTAHQHRVARLGVHPDV